MATLYTPEILRAAVGLVEYPRLDTADVSVNHRAKPCGSHIILDLNISSQGIVTDVGMRVTACAFGQAAAAIMAQSVPGKNTLHVVHVHDSISAWLRDATAPTPDWPGIGILAPARAYPARHGSILLPFAAVGDALNRATSQHRQSA